MNCEKFEPLLLDELYEELDEVTSAAVKHHVSACTRCASILSGLRKTRRAAALPLVDLPVGLEDRILASVADAKAAVPAPGRASRALSWAGRWAMRPQTAMAAVFLLMIGTSAFVIRSRRSEISGRAWPVSVTESGEPVGPVASANVPDSLDNKAAAAAHGPNTPAPTAFATPPAAQAAAPPSPRGELAASEVARSRPADDHGKGLLRDGKDEGRSDLESAESKTAGAAVKSADHSAAPSGGARPDSFAAGMTAYRSRDYGEAARQFDAAAKAGDPNAALWAAKSERDGAAGCAGAIARFDAVALKAAGTWIGHEATLESARCQIATGQLDGARDKLTRLTHVPSHAPGARQALGELEHVASRRQGEHRNSAGGSAPAAAAPRVPAKPAASGDF